MKSQSCSIASPPAKTPAAMERAGFTEVPVRPIVAKWIPVRARPMATGAAALAGFGRR